MGTVLVLAISEPVMKFWDDVGNHSKFSIPFRDCLYHVPRQIYWPLKVAIEL